MPSDALRVTTAHLQRWAATHSRAAVEMTAAVEHVSGADRRVRISHGTVAEPTARAVGDIEELRRIAGRRASTKSLGLHRSLDAVAHAYFATDSAAGIGMDRFLR